MMTRAMMGGSHSRATAKAVTAQDAQLTMMRIIRENLPPRDTRHTRRAVIENDNSGFCELRESQFKKNPIAASSTQARRISLAPGRRHRVTSGPLGNVRSR